MTPQLLAQGWGQAKVRERHMSFAHPLAAQGLQWRYGTAADRPGVEALVRNHISGTGPGWTLDKDSASVVVEVPGGGLIAALVVVPWEVDGHLVALIRHEVVEPAWRGKGVGTVTLGMLPQVFERGAGRAPDMTIGNCAPTAARFYQRAGFTVLQPGEPLVLPFGDPAAMGLSSTDYPCWFHRNF